MNIPLQGWFSELNLVTESAKFDKFEMYFCSTYLQFSI